MKQSKCKICRNQVKTFLKGERCLSVKCTMIKDLFRLVRKPERRSSTTEYGREVKEKQIKEVV